MAGPGSNNRFNAPMYLSPGQQDLLMAALNSNNPNAQAMMKQGQDFPSDTDNQQLSLDGINPAMFPVGQPNGFQDFGAVNLDNIDDSPFVDFLDGDTSFDFDTGADGGDLMIGSLPGGSEGDSPEKRKSPEDDDDEIEGGGKRREGDDKTAKKPGRKPLTSEPTTKRKAQNRAAQRAFRERKEKHLKDLETKVAELEKESDAANHENGLLRAQVQRLQTELREYRKRLSANSSAANRSPQNPFASYMSTLNSGNSNFHFEFPKFGANPAGQLANKAVSAKSNGLSNGARTAMSAANGVLARQGSTNGSLSPKSQSNGAATGAASPEKSASANVSQQGRINGSPAMLNGNAGSPLDAGTSPNANVVRGRTESSSGQSRVFQFNSGSTSSSTNSPSASSISQYGGGPNSSCGTSPEPFNTSPVTGKADGQLDSNPQGYVCHGNTEGEVTFCEKLNMACGTRQNPVPRAMSISNGNPANPAANTTVQDKSGIDFFANQNGGQFDPTLFGDYRDPQTAIVGEGDFSGGFFDDAFNIGTFSSPFNLEGITPGLSAPKTNPLEEIEKLQDGVEEEVVPGEDPTQMLNCHNIWDKLAQRSDFKDGTIDIDNLCTELRAKARCSESGVVVDNKDVEAALKRLPV